MKELSDEQVTGIWKGCLEIDNVAFCREFSRKLIAADRALNAPADRDVMRQAPNGWKLVPIEPTKDMVSAAQWEDGEATARAVWRQMIAEAPTPPAEQSGHDPAGPRDDRFVCDLCDEDGVIVYKRSEFTKNWTTFNVRKECANLAEERLKSPSLAELRAKVEALPKYATDKGWMVGRSDVLALLGDKS